MTELISLGYHTVVNPDHKLSHTGWPTDLGLGETQLAP